MSFIKNFAMVLGHNLSVANGVDEYIISKEKQNNDFDNTTGSNWLAHNGYVNYDTPSGQQSEYNGWSLAVGNSGGGCGSDTMGIEILEQSNANSRKIKAYLYGTYFNVPHSPDLKLTMTREMGDGVKRIRTKGGADLVNYRYTKQPSWGVAAPWELYGTSLPNNKLARSGRRVWDLSFSYFQDSDIFPEISNLNWFEAYKDEYNPDAGLSGVILYEDSVETRSQTLLQDDNFYSQVIHKTNGGQLPFVFQPNLKNYNDMAICKFDMKSFQFKQVANGVYNVKLKIREVW